MTTHELDLLQTTHDSTIRQEQVILQVQDVQATIKADLRKGSDRFDAIEKRQADMESVLNSVKKSRKLRSKVFWILVVALSYPCASWVWDKMTKFLPHP